MEDAADIEPLATTDTFSLLCRYARPAPPAKDTPSPLSQGLVDWSSLYQDARYHAVIPLVHMNRLRHGEDLDDWAHEDLDVTRTRGYFHIEELKRVLNVLDEAGIRALPFKGPVLTSQVFPDLRYRFSTDLDLLIEPNTLSAASSALNTAGFQPIQTRSAVAKRLRTLIHSQHTFTRGGAVFVLDVHTRIMPPLYAYAPDFEGLWKRSTEINLVGDPVRCLAPPDRLLMLCYQGVKNRWDRLKYVCDVAAALQAEDYDAHDLLDQARRLSSERALLLGVTLAHELLGAPLPKPVMEPIRTNHVISSLSQRVQDGLAHPGEQGITSLRDRASFQLNVQDGRLERLRYVAVASARKVIDYLSGSSV